VQTGAIKRIDPPAAADCDRTEPPPGALALFEINSQMEGLGTPMEGLGTPCAIALHSAP